MSDTPSHRPSHRPPGWAVDAAVAAAVGVVFYVAAWAIGGAVLDGFDPLRQAISETFAVGVQPRVRWFVTSAVIVTGVTLAIDGPALHRALPGEGHIGPALVTIAGLGTIAVGLAPCSAPDCPDASTSAADTAHVIAAAVAYLALMAAPVAFGVRLRRHLPWFAKVSLALGGAAIAVFGLRYAGAFGEYGGLQQRLFNTVADAWYVAAAIEAIRLRRHGQHHGE